MDSSKKFSGTEECSSSESGWTTYLASPEKEYNDEEDDDNDASIAQEGYKKDNNDEEDDSDDSMASDASSGPCGKGNLYSYGHAEKKDERKYVAKKLNQKEEKKQIAKGEKDKAGNRGNSGGRLKKF